MLDITIEKSAIRIGQRFAVSFQRTLRIPDDGQTYPLPPGLGIFPIDKVEDYQDKLPQAWREGGAFISMYQREALWLGFRGASWKPNAVKISIGGINAISGQPNDRILRNNPQDYLVVPNQPWLDGIKSGQGSIRQFVAMPLGLGYTVEAALTGQETYGGIQITVFEPKPGRFPDAPPPESGRELHQARSLGNKSASMGIGAGGTMKQKVYPDPYGLEVWDQENCGFVTVQILNSTQYRSITGQEPPPTPIDAATYTQYQLPWFDLYDEEKGDLTASEQLANVKTISNHDTELGIATDEQASFDVPETQIKRLREEETRVTDSDLTNQQ